MTKRMFKMSVSPENNEDELTSNFFCCGSLCCSYCIFHSFILNFVCSLQPNTNLKSHLLLQCHRECVTQLSSVYFEKRYRTVAIVTLYNILNACNDLMTNTFQHCQIGFVFVNNRKNESRWKCVTSKTNHRKTNSKTTHIHSN